MRLNEAVRKAGFFWLPSNRDNRLPGYLNIADGGHIEIEIVGTFDRDIINGSYDIPRLVGQIEGAGLVTLENCFYTYRPIIFGGGISRSKITANTAIFGVEYDEGEEIRLNSFTFRVEKLGQWLDLNGVDISISEDFSAANISFQRPESIKFNIDGVGEVQFCLEYSLPSTANNEETKITQKPYIKIYTKEEKDLSYFHGISYKIANFICFSADATLSILDVSGSSNAITRDCHDGTPSPVDLKIYYAARPFSSIPSDVEYYRMLFTHADIKHRIGDAFSRWFAAYDKILPAMHLYFLNKSGNVGGLEGRFLSLAQCLETYHRRVSQETVMGDNEFQVIRQEIIDQCKGEHKEWLEAKLKYGNEISLRRRMKRLTTTFSRYFGSRDDRLSLVSLIVDTRNYYTHYDDSLADNSAKGRDLYDVCNKMEVLFQLHLLSIIGFNDDDISNIVANSFRLRQNLKNQE